MTPRRSSALTAVFVIAGCADHRNDKALPKSDPLLVEALEHLQVADPRFVQNAGDQLIGTAVYGKRFDCVLFGHMGSKIIEGRDRVFCFERGTTNFVGRL